MSTAPSASLAANQSIIRGRVHEVKRTDKAVYTDIRLPAPDTFTSPQNIRVVSSALIGKPNEDITVRVELRGYRRAYTDKLGQTGYAVDNVLQVIEG